MYNTLQKFDFFQIFYFKIWHYFFLNSQQCNCTLWTICFQSMIKTLCVITYVESRWSCKKVKQLLLPYKSVKCFSIKHQNSLYNVFDSRSLGFARLFSSQITFSNMNYYYNYFSFWDFGTFNCLTNGSHIG